MQYKSPNEEIWKTYGILPEGYAVADKMMGSLLEVAKLDPSLVVMISKEAEFQLVELPKRTKEAQKKFGWK